MEDLAPTILPLLVGLVIGAALALLLSPARRNHRRMSRERDEALANLQRYREEVDQHFTRTAELVNNMTASYRAVHEHLSGGARSLCSENGRRLAAARSLDSLPGGARDEPIPGGSVSQPLDYAPSVQGTLSEDFGLNKKTLEPEGPFSPVDDLTETAQVSEEEIVTEPPRDYAEGCQDQGCSNPDEEQKRA